MPDKAPDERGETTALLWPLRSAVECALRWGWTEERLVRLIRIAYRWERDGAIPKTVDDDPEPVPVAPRIASREARYAAVMKYDQRIRETGSSERPDE